MLYFLYIHTPEIITWKHLWWKMMVTTDGVTNLECGNNDQFRFHIQKNYTYIIKLKISTQKSIFKQYQHVHLSPKYVYLIHAKQLKIIVHQIITACISKRVNVPTWVKWLICSKQYPASYEMKSMEEKYRKKNTEGTFWVVVWWQLVMYDLYKQSCEDGIY